MADQDRKIAFEIELPEGTTMGDVLAVKGALLEASTMFVDWEKLYNGEAEAISSEGVILLEISRQLSRNET